MEIREKMQEFMECSICCDKLLNPKMCPDCKKFICLSCFKSLKITRHETLLCPFCRQEEKKSSWKTNKYVNSLSENLNMIFSKYCELHKDDTAIHFCYDCKIPICGSCILENLHKNHRILRRETYEKILNVLKENKDKDNGAQKKIDELKMNIKVINEGEKLMIKFINKIKEKIKEIAVKLKDECNALIDSLSENLISSDTLKNYLENLSRNEYNFCKSIPIINGESNIMDESLFEGLTKRCKCFELKTELHYLDSEYEDQTYKDLGNIIYFNSMMKIYDENSNVNLFTKGKLNTNGYEYETYFDVKGKMWNLVEEESQEEDDE